MSLVCQEVKYLTKLLTAIITEKIPPSLIKCDNQGAIALVKNPVKHARSKHIDIRYHFVRENYADKSISIDYVPSNENVADIFTKPAKKNILKDFRQYIFGK